ncbi:hypothetical protein D5018_11450 [Parashewanella curva]|uniref:HTTM domain-containing protein n=1 Tax=Parashewanella curva TaxID=2338552 RepID=A0A3L8PZP3_9GAMM|nr:hypothetical protein [Parashewanella curva]RLV59562.1 hypothetical protein D5018_11450 [Parashewanella curva]
MIDFISLNAVAYSSFLVGLASLVISLETLVSKRLFVQGEILDWRTTRLSVSHWAFALFNGIFNFPWMFGFLTTAKALLSMLVIYQAINQSISINTLCLLFMIHQLSNYRMPIGRDGSMQMTSVMIFGLMLIAWPHHPYLHRLGLFFISAQIVIAYTASGWAKWCSPIWRHENVLAQIFNTKSFGRPRIASLLKQHVKLSRTASIAVMTWQASFPLVLFSSSKLLSIYLLIGFSFHLSIAIIMGLNTFLYSFTACYPILIIGINELHRVAPWLQVINWK